MNFSWNQCNTKIIKSVDLTNFLSNLMDALEQFFCVFSTIFPWNWYIFSNSELFSRKFSYNHNRFFVTKRFFIWMKNWWKSFWRKILHIIAILSQWMPDKKWTTRSHCRATLGKENDQLFERHVLTDGFPMLLSQKK